MRKLAAGVSGTVLFAAIVGCQTTPYDYSVEKNDAMIVEDTYAHPDQLPKLKVAVRPAKKNIGKKNIDEQVCARMKDLLAASDYFDIAVRDDLADIKVEDLNSGGSETDFTIVPSELLILVNANVMTYLGGTNPGRIAMWKEQRRMLAAKGKWDEVAVCDREIAKMQMSSVEDPAKAFGVGVNSICSAYNCKTLKQYVSNTFSENHVGELVGRTDVVISDASREIAEKFVAKLTDRLVSVMKVDCLVTETRGNGQVVKVDISAIAESERPKVGARAVVYTHEKGRRGSSRKEIASGEVWAVEAESVWVKVMEERGYGQPHIGHCADFK